MGELVVGAREVGASDDGRVVVGAREVGNCVTGASVGSVVGLPVGLVGGSDGREVGASEGGFDLRIIPPATSVASAASNASRNGEIGVMAFQKKKKRKTLG